ncbi:GMP/IMP nucleotidase [Thalassotalea ganghwensis]
MLDWSKITTVLLDMDGTILDLHYDNHFWLEYLPKRYSEMANMSFAQAQQNLVEHYERVQGTIAWYCLDYWAEQTKLPIVELKKEIAHLISLREDAKAFLIALKKSGRDIVLVTNAHPKSLSLKIERTQLDQYFDTLYSTHEFGVTKESQALWQKLQAHHGFAKERCLFVDDSPTILESAQRFGIGQLLAVANPDSKRPNQEITGFETVTDFTTLIPALHLES